jgi:nitrate reductase molybdenum cofactor assembly chaperone
MKQANAGSVDVSSAMSAQCATPDALRGACADGTSALPAMAVLLEYPGFDWESQTKARLDHDLANDFVRAVRNISLSELQELYTRTFDLNPACALEVGYHLFGENYKRGEFLANLRETEAPFDLGQAQQLPDYLPVLLRLLPKLEDQELRTSLIAECLIPAIEKMLTTFKDAGNPYRLLLVTVVTTLRAEIPDVSRDQPEFIVRASLPVIQPAEQATA